MKASVWKKENAAKEDYLAYVAQLGEHGFKVCADSGSEGIGGTVCCTTLAKGEGVFTVAYYARQNEIGVSFYNGPVSEHLVYRESFLDGNQKHAKTKLYMSELWRLGNSFLFQLKNNHFVISDGGLPADLPYLLDLLESLAPEGEKPVIEAWVISHAHVDHCGALCAFGTHPEWLERICCDGIYFNEPGDEVLRKCHVMMDVRKIRWAATFMKDSNGEPTMIYRPQTGQRYYFNDMTMDILLCQEQVPEESYKGDINNASTVCLFTIEGQKCFLSGDIHQSGLQFIMDNYTKEYLQLDLFTLNHHGFNVSIPFADYATVKTLLVTLRDTLPVRNIREAGYMISKAEESMMWGDGTKVLTFPYKVGSYECMPQKKWIYNEGEERPLQPNLYTFHNRWAHAFIVDADTVLFEDGRLKEDVLGFLQLAGEKEIPMTVYSGKTTGELTELLERNGISGRFERTLGSDQLDPNDLYADAFRKSEEQFQLSNFRKIVILCCSMDAVASAVSNGYKTVVVKQGRPISREMETKCWLAVDSLDKLQTTPLREFRNTTYLEIVNAKQV